MEVITLFPHYYTFSFSYRSTCPYVFTMPLYLYLEIYIQSMAWLREAALVHLKLILILLSGLIAFHLSHDNTHIPTRFIGKCVCVCVCVCVRLLYVLWKVDWVVCVCVCVYDYVCVHMYTYLYRLLHILCPIALCVCVCEHVWVLCTYIMAVSCCVDRCDGFLYIHKIAGQGLW